MSAEEHRQRRRRLMAAMGEGGVAVLPAARESVRNRDVHYPFRQDSDFHYLTGFDEPDAVAVLAPGRQGGEFIMFCRERDPLMEIWNGRRAGPEGLLKDFGADEAYPLAELDGMLPRLLENREQVFYAMGVHEHFDRRMMQWLNQVRAKERSGVRAPRGFVDLGHLIHEMRLCKSRVEMDIMRASAAIATSAHGRAMTTCRPGLREYHLQAELEHEFRRHGCEHAYPPIVAAGGNACILHYTENRSELVAGELLLIDAGAELQGYASDVTRTFPIDGSFRGEQRALYEVVLAAQQAAIDRVRPGADWNATHETAVAVLTEGLRDLGLLQGELGELIETEAYRRFYMHRTGHWLGRDVHDVGEYKQGGLWRPLEPGMVLTVEPGLYVAEGSEGVDEAWWNIGIRIEDDVAVTADGHEVLSAGLPRSAEDIEALMRDGGAVG